jgi:Mn2+/Fe2+ NRAMP family transporter
MATDRYVIDKRITPRFICYERADLWIGILLVIIGAVAMMAFTAAAFAGRPAFGSFQDAGAVAAGLSEHVGHAAGAFFAVALIDASVIGAMAVTLSTAYAIGDVLSFHHSLHRKPKEAKAFYAVYGGLVTLAAALVLTPGAPLGLLTNAVQALAGVLLPTATVFLLLLCNDHAVLGPWVNGRALSVFTGAVIAALVMLSIILTASVFFNSREKYLESLTIDAIAHRDGTDHRIVRQLGGRALLDRNSLDVDWPTESDNRWRAGACLRKSSARPNPRQSLHQGLLYKWAL